MIFRLAAAVLDWYDGDTFHGVLDHGLGWYQGKGLAVVGGRAVVEPIRHRCWLIDTPEMKTGAPGTAARDFARLLAPPGVYEAMSYKPDDFGRPLVDLVLADGRLFSAAMIAAGHAVRFTP